MSDTLNIRIKGIGFRFDGEVARKHYFSI